MHPFGEEVSKLMDEKKLTQQQLATRIGVHQTFVSKLIRGERDRLGADILFKLCDALGVSCDHFRPFLTDDVAEAPEPAAPAPAKGKKK